MVLDIHGGSADVNKGMGGKYTYVIKVMTTNPAEAATSFVFFNQNTPLPKEYYGDDYAEGAGGDYRYIKKSFDREKSPIRWDNLKLCRGSVPHGWGSTTDLNKGRGGDDLYLIWKIFDPI